MASNFKFHAFLAQLSSDYPGNKYRWLRLLLYDYIPINRLDGSVSGIELFNELYEQGRISYTNVNILSDIAEITVQQSAISRINEFRTNQCDSGEGPRLSEFRRTLFTALREVTLDDLRQVVGFYQLDVYDFGNIWDVVFYLENKNLLNDTEESCVRFADLLNARAKGILLGSIHTTGPITLTPVVGKVVKRFVGYQPTQRVASSTSTETSSLLPTSSANLSGTIRDYLLGQMTTVCSKLSRITPATWNTRFQIDIAHMFTDLVLLKENKRKQDAKKTTLQEVLKIITSTPACRVILEGEGGIGKSTLLKFLAYNWATGNDTTFKGKLIFLVNIRDVKESCLDAIIKLVDVKEQTSIGPGYKCIKRFIRDHDDEIVLLLDGLDELKRGITGPMSIFNKRQLGKCTVILTTRPGEIDELIAESDIHVKVKGFNETNIENYIRRYFEHYEESTLGDTLLRELGLYQGARARHSDVLSLCKNPMLLLTICTIWEDTEFLSSDKSSLFKAIFCCVLNQYITRHVAKGRKITSFERTPPEYIQAMLALGKCMYTSLKSNKLAINKKDIEGRDQIVKMALELGFVYKDVPIHKHDFEEMFTPPHKSIVESLVGFYLSKVCKVEMCDDSHSSETPPSDKDSEHCIVIKAFEENEWEMIRNNTYLKGARLFAIGFLGKEADLFLKHWITDKIPTWRNPLLSYLGRIKEEIRTPVERMIIHHISTKSNPKITADVCNSLWRCIRNVDPSVNSTDNLFQLIRKLQSLERRVSVMTLLGKPESMDATPKPCGKMIAHLLVAVNEEYVLKENTHLCNERVVKVLLHEFKKLGLQYQFGRYTFDYSHYKYTHPLLLSHIVWNVPHITNLDLEETNTTGSAMNYILKDYLSGVVLQLESLTIKNDLSEIEGASLSSLLLVTPNLNFLNISRCRLSGDVVNSMVQECLIRRVMLKTKHLEIGNNDLSTIKGVSLAYLLMASKLEKLKMSYCMLSGDVVNDMVRECSNRSVELNLQLLEIDHNDLSTIKGTSLAYLHMAPKLEKLKLSACMLSGGVVNDMVRECSSRKIVLNLQRLEIDDNDLSTIKGASLAYLFMAARLEKCKLSACMLSGGVVNAMIRECLSRRVVLNLQRLEIDNNDLSTIKGASLAYLLMAPKLEKLKMSSCMLSGDAVNDMVKECSSSNAVLNIKRIKIHQNNLSTIKGSSLAYLLMAPKMKKLKMSYCKLSGNVVNEMVIYCLIRKVVLSIKWLKIHHNDLSTVKGDSLAYLIHMAPRMQTFDINSCMLSGDVVNDMVRECYNRNIALMNMQCLDLSYNNLSAIEGTSLLSLIEIAPIWSRLKMIGCMLAHDVVDTIKRSGKRALIFL